MVLCKGFFLPNLLELLGGLIFWRFFWWVEICWVRWLTWGFFKERILFMLPGPSWNVASTDVIPKDSDSKDMICDMCCWNLTFGYPQKMTTSFSIYVRFPDLFKYLVLYFEVVEFSQFSRGSFSNQTFFGWCLGFSAWNEWMEISFFKKQVGRLCNQCLNWLTASKI